LKRSLFAELKRRNVFKAGVAYLALGWVVTQITSTVAPALHLPDWVVSLVLWIGVIGFPFVIMFSWVYEITPEGLKRESEVDRSASITHVTGRRLDYIIIGLLVLAIGFSAFDRYGPRRSGTGTSSEMAAPAAVSAGSSAAPAATPGAPAIADNSIAVLPFVNMSSDKEQDYFSDGLSEELLNLLAQVPQLRVIARTSSFAFKGKEIGVAEIAKALNVANVLEGSVRKSGDTLRVTAQLIRAADSSHLWSETYDRQLTDVFKVQDEIAGAVVAQLKVKLLPAQQVTNTHRTANPEAYNQYLLGNQIAKRGTEESARLAVVTYRKAIALDPGYAPAYAGLAFAEAYATDYATSLEESAAGKRRASEAADKAIALAPELADGYSARGLLRMGFAWDWSGAQADLEKALSLEPSSALAQRRYGLLLLYVGRQSEGIAATRKAIELDPLATGAWSALGSAYSLEPAQYGQAREAFNRAVAISPDAGVVNYHLAQLELLEGHAQEALRVSQRAGPVLSLVGIAMAEHSLGHAAESQAAADQLIAKYADNVPAQIAELYAWRGENDKAFEWLERAYVVRDPALIAIRADPILAPLRSDPRFAAMLKKLGLPQ
jgi:TolB-like protein/tetratricopeptide (TPR) repeat protein